MRVMSLPAVAVVLASLSIAAPAVASGVVADPARIAEVMRKARYTVERKPAEGGEYLIASFGKESYSFNIYFFGCDEKTTRNCKSVQFYSGFSPKTKPTLEAMNAYASDNRWGRIYLDKNKDPVIEMDVDLEDGGVSEALFLDNVEYFETVMNRFAEFAFKK